MLWGDHDTHNITVMPFICFFKLCKFKTWQKKSNTSFCSSDVDGDALGHIGTFRIQIIVQPNCNTATCSPYNLHNRPEGLDHKMCFSTFRRVFRAVYLWPIHTNSKTEWGLSVLRSVVSRCDCSCIHVAGSCVICVIDKTVLKLEYTDITY